MPRPRTSRTWSPTGPLLLASRHVPRILGGARASRAGPRGGGARRPDAGRRPRTPTAAPAPSGADRTRRRTVWHDGRLSASARSGPSQPAGGSPLRRSDRSPTARPPAPPVEQQEFTHTRGQSRSSSCAWARSAQPYYRIVVADARTKRDGRAIEEIGKYHPKEDPSFIEVDSERAQYWLGVGAQPTEPSPRSSRSPATGRSSRARPRRRPAGRRAEGRQEGRLRGRRQGHGRRANGRAPPPRRRRPRRRRPLPRRPRPRRPLPRLAAAEAPRCRGRAAEAPAEARRRGAGTEAPAEETAEPRPRPPRPGRRPRVLEEALEHLVRGIVDHPDDVDASTCVTCRRGRTPRGPGAPEDLGKVIGRGGRTATALRTVVGRRRRPRSRRPRRLRRRRRALR